jgi:hypothetical protein
MVPVSLENRKDASEVLLQNLECTLKIVSYPLLGLVLGLDPDS